MAYRYRYDQLNRLTGMNASTYLCNTSDTNVVYTSMQDYGEHVSYDPNGNIMTYFRNGTTAGGSPLAMDSLSYKYQNGNNRLDHVNDAVPSSNYSVDIDNEDTLNYQYDQIGNLTKDSAGGIDTIYWTVYGKIQQINKYNGDTIRFHYDPSGNRIAKEVYKDSLHKWIGTYYVHDATGNIMSTYHWYNKDTFNLDELVMYGSSRLGTIGANQYLTDTITRDSLWYVGHTVYTNPLCDSISYYATGLKQYEFTNHLGNVLVTLTDKHIPFYFGSFAFYIPEVASAQDYYPFGMIMPGRNHNDFLYRFGFNKGAEKDDEIAGVGNHINTFYREGDVRLAIWWGIDPEPKAYLSSYSFMSGNPILFNDPRGDETDPKEFNADKAGALFFGLGRSFYNSAIAVKNAATHPKETLNSLYHMMRHPVNAVKTIYSDAKQQYQNDKAQYGDLGTQVFIGDVIGQGVQVFVPVDEASKLLKKATGLDKAASVWQLTDQMERGLLISKMLGENLPPGFKTFDKWLNGTATSIKSIDLTAKTYQNAATLKRTLTGYVDKTLEFEKYTKEGTTIEKSMIQNRVVDVAIQDGVGTAAQKKILNEVVQYGKSKGVDVNIKSMK